MSNLQKSHRDKDTGTVSSTCYLLQFMVGQLRFILSACWVSSRKHAKAAEHP